MPQDPPERVHAAAGGPRLAVPGARRRPRGRQLHGRHRVALLVLVLLGVLGVLQTAHARVEAVRRLLAVHPRRDGEEGGDPHLLGDGDRRLRGGERRARQHS